MTQSEYEIFAERLAGEAKVVGGVHGYFLSHRSRLWQTATHFDLWRQQGKQILEIGPFYSYTPFALREQGNEVCVFEGEDPIVYPLKSLYAARGINFVIGDFAQSFGAASSAQHRLPFADAQFDLLSCWETMEHFNFNPVGFVRELHRVLKPGGQAFITVPNVASLETRLKLLCGQGIGTSIDSYQKFYDYAGGNFLGFHWREYVLSELVQLFSRQNFEVVSADHLLTYQNYESVSALKNIKRLVGKTVFALVPSTGRLCALVVRKPAAK